MLAMMRSRPCEVGEGGWGCLCFSVQRNVAMTADSMKHDGSV